MRLASADTALSSGRSEWTGLLLVLYIAKHVRGDLVVRALSLVVVQARQWPCSALVRWSLPGPVDLRVGTEPTRNTRDQCVLFWWSSSSGRRTLLGALGPYTPDRPVASQRSAGSPSRWWLSFFLLGSFFSGDNLVSHRGVMTVSLSAVRGVIALLVGTCVDDRRAWVAVDRIGR